MRAADGGRRAAGDDFHADSVGLGEGGIEGIEGLFERDKILHRSNSFLGQLAATRAGIGLGVHDCFIADAIPEMERLMPGYFHHTLEAWLVTHPDVRRSARIHE